MVLYCISLRRILKYGIFCYLMVLHCIVLYCIVSYVILWYPISLHGIACCCAGCVSQEQDAYILHKFLRSHLLQYDKCQYNRTGTGFRIQYGLRHHSENETRMRKRGD